MGLVIFAGFFLYFLLRNILCPLFADDYSYAFVWDGEHFGNLIDGIGIRKRVKSLKDIITSMYSHYFTWSGRIFAHSIVQLFMLLGKTFFNIVNTLVFGVLMLVILALGGSGLNDAQSVLWVLAGFWFGVPFLIGTALWLTGSCNYLWMSLIQCVFILPYAHGFSVNTLMISVLGFMAGLTNEPGGIGVLVICLSFMTEGYFYGNIMLWHVIGLIFFCAGYAVIMLAPGNMNQFRLTLKFEPEYTIPENLLWTRGMLVRNLRTGFLPVMAHELILYIPIAIYFLQGGSFAGRTGIYIIVFCLGSMSVLCAMMFSPEFPDRAGFPSAVFLLPASVCALEHISGGWLVKIFAAMLLADMALCLWEDIYFHRQIRERFRLIHEQQDRDLVVVPEIVPSRAAHITSGRTMNNYVIFWGDIDDKTAANRNIMFAQYYGLKAIMTESSDSECYTH